MRSRFFSPTGWVTVASSRLKSCLRESGVISHFLRPQYIPVMSLAMMFLFPLLPVDAATLVVQPNQSIQIAIRRAQAGDTILIKPGRYHESLTLQSGITLKGEGNPEISWDRGTVIWGRQVRNARIEGLSIRSSAPASIVVGAVVLNDAEVAISRCQVQSESHGIAALGNSMVDLRENTLQDNRRAGIFLSHGTRGQAIANTARRNGSAGIEVTGQSHVIIQNNLLSDNPISGVIFSQKATGLLVENLLKGNGKWGAFIMNDAAPEIKRNVMTLNGDAGLCVQGQAKPKVYENLIWQNFIDGVLLEWKADAVVERNTIIGHKRTGLRAINQSKGAIAYNVISQNEIGMSSIDRQFLPSQSQLKLGLNWVEDNIGGGYEGGDLVADSVDIPFKLKSDDQSFILFDEKGQSSAPFGWSGWPPVLQALFQRENEPTPSTVLPPR